MTTTVFNKKSVLNAPIVGISTCITTLHNKPVEIKIMKPWVADLNYAQPSTKYLNPHFERTSCKNFKKLWKHKLKPQAQKTIPQSFSGKILVPYPLGSAFLNADAAIGKAQALSSQNNITCSKPSKTNLAMLHFDAVDWQCNIFINGKKVGTHVDVCELFSFNLNPSFGKRKQQHISSQIWNPTNQNFLFSDKKVQQPKSIWYETVSGKYQTVCKVMLPATYVVSTNQSLNISGDKLFKKYNSKYPINPLYYFL